jgi:hypothetical protein
MTGGSAIGGCGFEHVTTVRLTFRPVDQAAVLERLLSLGARRADVGQRDASWVVLADPEGNEFCILRGRVRPDS